MNGSYTAGDLVLVKSTGEVITINKVLPGDQETHYSAFVNGKKRRFKESDLLPYIDSDESMVNALATQDFRNANQFLLYSYFHKLSESSDSNIYSYQGNKIIFNPFQYKPLMKFISADSEERLLIADEVGVGKTIEAGIILDELLARQELSDTDLVLIVCPNILTQKWKQEMREKFGMGNFYIHNGQSLKNMLEELSRDGKTVTARSIVGEQLFRNPIYAESLKLSLARLGEPFIKMLIVDECHHYRNPTTATHHLGMVLSRCAERVLMLSATPFNLREDDLFNQLKMLNESQFSDFQMFKQLGNQVRSVNKSIAYLREYPENRQRLIHELSNLLPVVDESNYIKDEFDKIRDCVNSESRIPTQSVVSFEKTLAMLNPLASSFTRTLKRDALSHRVTRETKTIVVHFTDQEAAIYQDFVDANLTRYQLKGVNPRAFALITNTLERIAASSIPALVSNIEKYSHIGIEVEDDVDSVATAQQAQQMLSTVLINKYDRLRDQLLALGSTDSKFDALESLINAIRSASAKNQRVMIFSYYIGTLKYLRKRLSETGYRVGLMYGQTPDDTPVNRKDEDGFEIIGRYELIEAFKSQKIDILLASEVGGEGLDFQFCAALINYDLPYNPMRIEQRIGRIDRMGQKSDKVIIGNLCIDNTVDMVINRVLLSRIENAADLVGDLEPIITNEMIEVNQLIITKGFSNAEIEKRIHEMELRVEEEKSARESFDEQRYELVNDSGFRDEFESDLERSRIKPQDSLNFTMAFLREQDGCWSKQKTNTAASIHISNAIKSRLKFYYNRNRFNNSGNELLTLAKSTEDILVDFNGGQAYDSGTSVFLKPCGPWIHFLIDSVKDTMQPLEGNVFHAATACAKDICWSEGTYCIFVYDYSFTGFHDSNSTHYIAVDVDTEKCFIPTADDWKKILANLENSKKSVQIDSEELQDFQEIADITAEADIKEQAQKIAGGNEVKINSRIQALRNLSQMRIEKYTSEARNEDEEQAERLKKAIARDRDKTEKKVADLEKRKKFGFTTAFQSVLILDVY